jgi:hemerythrin
MAITWSNKLEVGHEGIDDQHKALVQMCNDIKVAQSSQAINTVILKMSAYTREHFDYEEGVMRDARYPRLAEHQQEHHTFIMKVGKLLSDASGKQFNGKEIEEIYDFLIGWLLHHILKSDKAFVTWNEGNKNVTRN